MSTKSNTLPEEFENLKNECAPILTRYRERIEQFHNDFVGLTTVEYAGQPEASLSLRELDSGKFDDFFYDLSEINTNKEPLNSLFYFETNNKNVKIIENELTVLSPFTSSTPMFYDLHVTGDVKINEAVSDIYNIISQPVIFRNCVFEDTFDIISKDEPINLNANFRFENVTFKGDVSLGNIDGSGHSIVFDGCTFEARIHCKNLDFNIEILNSSLVNRPVVISSPFVYYEYNQSQIPTKKIIGIIANDDDPYFSRLFQLATTPKEIELVHKLKQKTEKFEQMKEQYAELITGYYNFIDDFAKDYIPDVISVTDEKISIQAEEIKKLCLNLKEYVTLNDPDRKLREIHQFRKIINIDDKDTYDVHWEILEAYDTLSWMDKYPHGLMLNNLDIQGKLKLSDELSYFYINIYFHNCIYEAITIKNIVQEELFPDIQFTNMIHVIDSKLPEDERYARQWNGNGIELNNIVGNHNIIDFFASNMQISINNLQNSSIILQHINNDYPISITNSLLNNFSFSNTEEIESSIMRHIRIRDCIFNGDFELKDSIYPLQEMTLENVTIKGKSNFKGIKIANKASFTECTFEKEVNFSAAIFQQGADFSGSTFKGEANFNNAKFKNTTRFTEIIKDVDGKKIEQKCIFNIPPKFHNAKLHKDITFSQSNFDGCLDKLRKHYDHNTADDYARAFMTLRQHMSNLSNDIETTRFFKYEQKVHQFKYWYENKTINWLISFVYEIISQFGNSTVKPILWLFGIWVLCGCLFSDNLVIINSGLLESKAWTTQIGTNHPIILGFAYSTQSIIDPLSLFNTDVTFYPKTLFAAILAKIEAISGITIITLWIFAIRRRFQKGE